MTLIMIQPGTRHSTQHTTDPLSAQRTIHPHQQPLAAALEAGVVPAPLDAASARPQWPLAGLRRRLAKSEAHLLQTIQGCLTRQPIALQEQGALVNARSPATTPVAT